MTFLMTQVIFPIKQPEIIPHHVPYQPRKPGSLYLRGLRLRPWFRLVTWDFMNLLPKGERGKYQITCFHIKNVTLHLQGVGYYVLFYII